MFTAGFGLAAAYIEDHLRAWGVKPAGDHGSYLQTVRVLGVKTTSHSTVTRRRSTARRARSRTATASPFRRTWAASGASRSIASSSPATVSTRRRRPHRLPRQGREGRRRRLARRGAARRTSTRRSTAALLTGRNRYAIEQLGAAASIGPAAGGWRWPRRAGAPAAPAGAGTPARGGRGVPIPAADFTTVQRLDTPIAAERHRDRRVLRRFSSARRRRRTTS